MAKQVTINGNTYTLNQQGDNPPWGDDIADLLQALVDVSTSTTNTGDILVTSFAVANNVSSPTNITGLQFDQSVIRSAVINYSLYRVSSLEEYSELGIVLATYNNVANIWEFARTSVGDAGITFSVSNGQFKYTSTELTGSSYSGTLKFSAKAFTQ